MKNKKILKILKSYKSSINIKDDWSDLDKINAFVPTQRNLNIIIEFLDTINNRNAKAILLSGAYGTGKSYIASILLSLLSPDVKEKDVSVLLQKIKTVSPVLYANFKKHVRYKYITIFPKEIFRDFKQSISAGIKDALDQYGLELNKKTVFSSVYNKVIYWKEEHKTFYEKLVLMLSDLHIDISVFLKRINDYDKEAYQIFEDLYPQIIGGEKFYPENSISTITEMMKNLEKAAIEKGYDGVLYLFDELGRYLEKNIDTVDVKEIQDAAEYCSSRSKSTFFCITHKDIFQYAKKVRNDENRFEWEKVSGRFTKEHLTYEDNNIHEILKVILNKNGNYKELKKAYPEKFQKQHTLLANLNAVNNIDVIIDNLYPLNYIFASLLSGLSQKLAQNERTMFSFLCGNESKSLRNIYDNSISNVSFLGTDKLFDYFEENFKYLDEKKYKIYLSSKSILNKLSIAETIEKKVIKTIALVNILDNYSLLPPKIEYLSVGLAEEGKVISQSCDYLKEQGFITNRGIDGKDIYKIVSDIDINVNREVNKYINHSLSDFDYIDNIMEHIPPGYVYPVVYNHEKFITRYFKKYYVDLANLSKIDRVILKDMVVDGKIVYLLNLADKASNVQTISEAYKDIIFISNSEELKIVEDIKELETVHRLITTRADINSNDVVLGEFVEFKEETKEIIDKQLKAHFSFSSKIEIIINGKKYKIKTEKEFQNFLTNYLSNKYNKYQPLNYELINKTKLSVPIKKCRREIIKAISLGKANAIIEENYFNKTGAENSIARVLLKNTGIWKNHKIDFRKSCFENLYFDIIKYIQKELTLLDEVYSVYTGNQSVWGFRKAFFTFLLGLILEMHCEEIYISLNDDEVTVSPELFDKLDSKTTGYAINYIEYTEDKRYLLKELYSKLRTSIDNAVYEKNQSLAVLHGLRLFLYVQPKLVLQELSDNNYVKKILQNLSVNNSKEFFFKKMLNIYLGANDFWQVTKELMKTIELIEGKTEELRNELIQIVINKINPPSKDISLRNALSFWYNSLPGNVTTNKEKNNKLDLFTTLCYNIYDYKGDELTVITEIVNGFDFYKWRSRDDIINFSKEFDSIISSIKKKVDASCEINSSKNDVLLSPLAKLLKGKLNADIKNMGQSITPEEIKNILKKMIEEL